MLMFVSITFLFKSSNPIDRIVIEASQLTSDEYRTGCKVVNLRSWCCDSFKIAIHEMILEPESSVIAAIIKIDQKSEVTILQRL